MGERRTTLVTTARKAKFEASVVIILAYTLSLFLTRYKYPNVADLSQRKAYGTAARPLSDTCATSWCWLAHPSLAFPGGSADHKQAQRTNRKVLSPTLSHTNFPHASPSQKKTNFAKAKLLALVLFSRRLSEEEGARAALSPSPLAARLLSLSPDKCCALSVSRDPLILDYLFNLWGKGNCFTYMGLSSVKLIACCSTLHDPKLFPSRQNISLFFNTRSLIIVLLFLITFPLD